MPKSQLESHTHKLLVKEWHGQTPELVNMSMDKTGGFERMHRHMAGFVVVESTEPCSVTSSYEREAMARRAASRN